MKKRNLKRHFWHSSRKQIIYSAEWTSVHTITFLHLRAKSAHLLTYRNYSSNQRSPWDTKSAVGSIDSFLPRSCLLVYCRFMNRSAVLVCPTVTRSMGRYSAWWEQTAACPDIPQRKPRTCVAPIVISGQVSWYLHMTIHSLNPVLLLLLLLLQGNVTIWGKFSNFKNAKAFRNKGEQ